MPDIVGPMAPSEDDVKALKAYRVGVDDVLSVRVYREMDLSGPYRVASDGTLSMPLIGTVHVVGLSVPEIETLLVTRYKDGYLVEPSISVQVEKYRPFYIMGEVEAPGQYDYSAYMNVLNAVAQAGGFTYRAKQDVFELLRVEPGVIETEQDYRPIGGRDIVLPGDVIMVQERLF